MEEEENNPINFNSMNNADEGEDFDLEGMELGTMLPLGSKGFLLGGGN